MQLLRPMHSSHSNASVHKMNQRFMRRACGVLLHDCMRQVQAFGRCLGLILLYCTWKARGLHIRCTGSACNGWNSSPHLGACAGGELRGGGGGLSFGSGLGPLAGGVFPPPVTALGLGAGRGVCLGGGGLVVSAGFGAKAGLSLTGGGLTTGSGLAAELAGP